MATSSNFKQEGFLLYTSPPIINTIISTQPVTIASGVGVQAGGKKTRARTHNTWGRGEG
jgi:hypothetical protein